MGFVHLHVHSQYSLLDGTLDPKQIAKLASKQEMPAVALTDSCNLYGAVAFYKACKGAGLNGILGSEVTIEPRGLGFAHPAREEGGYQVILLVKNDAGYKSLSKLVTTAIFDGIHYKPRIDLAQLRTHSEGLIALTGGRKGLVGRSLSDGGATAVQERFQELADIFDKEHLYIELCDLGLEGQEAINDACRVLAKDTGYDTVVTNAVHYAEPEDAAALEVLHAINQGCSLTHVERIQSPTDQAYFKTEAEVRALFPEDGAAIERTVEIAERCEYHFDFDTYHFPATTPPDVDPDDPTDQNKQPDTDANWEYFYRAFPPPKDYGLPDPEEAIPPRPEGAGSINGYFDWYSERGLDLRLEHVPDASIHETYRERLKVELDIIKGMKFPAYLLIVAEFINWSKDNAIPVGPGRGSAAGSLVAYAMRITDIDPIRFDLLFERFLNPERVSMPDIDVDFCQDRREEAIEHVREKYGSPLVSQIITYGKLKAKAAIRDVARVLDMSFNEADRVAKLIPDTLGITLSEAIKQTEDLRKLRDGDPKVRRLLTLALSVEGNLRQTGVHAAGVVIADKPLVEYAPLYRLDADGGPVVQYDMKSAEGIGLIKFDFLGLKTLDQIRDAVEMIDRNHGVAIDMALIDVADQATYELLQQGDALGIFQLESSGMRDLLTRLKPNVLDDLVALVALYRPGPLSSGMTDDFVDRKHGRQKVEYLVPMLEPILKNTYGTIVYQEQVMQIAQVMAGYSLGGADILRRAMGKKDAAEMDRQRGIFVEGSVNNGVDRQKAEDIFDLLAKFAAYGFNKSHSAAYGYISYQTAFLKAHYRPEYMAALMTIEASNTDKLLPYLEDCRKAGIDVQPVCVNESMKGFDVPKGKRHIRYGLTAVKGLGGGAVDAILEARSKAGGRFEQLSDFFDRIDYRSVNKKAVEGLVKSGAMDFAGIPRAALLAGLEAAMSSGSRKQQDEAVGQVSLFGAMQASSAAPKMRWPNVEEWSLPLKLRFEHETLGLYLTGHPMEAYYKDVQRFATASIHELADIPGDQVVRLIGLVANVNIRRTKRGDKMAFIRLEDDTGGVECTFFPEPWMRSTRAVTTVTAKRSATDADVFEPLMIVGKVEFRGEELQIRASAAEPLSDIRLRETREVRIRVDLDELAGRKLPRLVHALDEQSGPIRCCVVVRAPGRFEAEIMLKERRVYPGTRLEMAMHELFGRRDVVGYQ
ncbi:MAG: DNA polymerase III subunit alpha [Proteobacteria bacterium]|nr:DNA polymerase III subunit alpha [Pseudomonadota bacterium]